MKSFLTAGFALATCAAFAAMSENFNNMEADTTISGNVDWAGGTVKAETGGNVLVFDGTVSCSNAVGAVGSEFVKTSFLVFAPTEGMSTNDLPTGAEVSGCQIAVATGEETSQDSGFLNVMVYQGSTPAWTNTTLTVATGQWFTVTLHFDYTANTAKIQIGQNGENSVAGPYTLVSTAAAGSVSKINSLSFVGSSKIDDVSIAEAIAKSTLVNTLDGLEIYEADLPSGVTVDNLKSDNNYTKHIEAGLTPSDSPVTFNATALSTESTQTVITVPCDKDYGQVYQVVINDTTTVPATAGDIEGGARALTFTVPSELTSTKVLKFQVKVGVLTPPSNT